MYETTYVLIKGVIREAATRKKFIKKELVQQSENLPSIVITNGH